MTDKLKDLRIDPSQKKRSQSSLWAIFIGVGVVIVAAALLARPRESDSQRTVASNKSSSEGSSSVFTPSTNTPAASADVALTASGYIVNRARIELSPRFLGVVKWIGVKKGDSVTNGQTVVLLDDTEYKARLRETEGRLAHAKAALTKAELDYQRITQLARTDIESKQRVDDARLQVEASHAALSEAEGTQELAQTYLEWCIIRSPINGVVLEKLVDADELVVPQSFGGPRGPSTALIAVADPKDLQVEVDVNESDLSKISLNQKCRVSPEAYPEKHYEGEVVEIAPEADRAKGTLQIKVQVRNPDRFLTPQLSAKVEFLKD